MPKSEQLLTCPAGMDFPCPVVLSVAVVCIRSWMEALRTQASSTHTSTSFIIKGLYIVSRSNVQSVI